MFGIITGSRREMFLKENLEFRNILEFNKIKKLDESQKETMTIDVAKKIYAIAIEKLPEIDFGDIPVSKGDITKYIHYTTMTDALEVLEQAAGVTADIETVKIALKNLETNIKGFTKAFADNIQVLQYLYNLTVLACMQSVSLLISSYLDFIKNPSGEYTYKLALDNTKKIKTMDALCLNNLTKFNLVCQENGINKMAFDSKNFVGTTAGVLLGTSIIVTSLLLIVPIIRELIYQFFFVRTTISDYIDSQVALIELSHATHSGLSKDIVKKQEKVAKTLSKLADKIRVEDRTAEKRTEDKIKHEKIKPDEVETNPMANFGGI